MQKLCCGRALVRDFVLGVRLRGGKVLQNPLAHWCGAVHTRMVLAVDGGESVNSSFEPSEVECLSGGPNQAPPLLRGCALLRDPFTPTLISSPQQIRSYRDVDPCRVIPLALVHAIEESLSYHLVLIAADRLSLSGSLPPCRSLRSPETRPRSTPKLHLTLPGRSCVAL